MMYITWIQRNLGLNAVKSQRDSDKISLTLTVQFVVSATCIEDNYFDVNDGLYWLGKGIGPLLFCQDICGKEVGVA